MSESKPIPESPEAIAYMLMEKILGTTYDKTKILTTYAECLAVVRQIPAGKHQSD